MSKRRGMKAKSAPKIGIKDNSQFLEALKLYEAKNYKKSIKLLETILKKDSGNADALALKGLDLLSSGEKEEAKSYVNNAISKISGTSASSICCHVLGIYMRTTKDYQESVKWFQASLDNGSTNKQIYRDLATLQSQIGDFKAALVSRKKYWEAFLGYRANWTALAVSQDINGERQQAVNTLSQFEKLAEGKISESEKYEHSECLIYKNDVMYKSAGNNKDKLQNVIKHLGDIESQTFDKYGLLERKASALMKMGEMKEASIVYRTLVKRNPDNFIYYKLLEVSLGIQGNNKIRKALYEKLSKFYPRCEPPKYIPLTFIQDETELTKKLEEYILPQLKRGVPATFSNVKPLYQKRGSIIPRLAGVIAEDYLKSLDKKENPIQYIWTCYYLSQHYLFNKDFQKAKECIDRSLDHTPTLVEFYILKARILKHIGLLEDAANTLEEGRQLDLQDRFINCKTVKYFLRANKMDKAVEIASLFTKNEDSKNGIKDLHLVEAAWFIVEQGEAYYRMYLDVQKKLNELKASLEEITDKHEETKESDAAQEQLISEIKDSEWLIQKYKGLSLKRFLAISKFYKQFEDDQLDFHSYCMRKGTPRAYLEMLEWGKSLYTKPMYVRAMKGASNIYFEIYDSSLKRKNQDENNIISSNKKAKKEAAALNKRKEQEKKDVLAYPADQDDDVFGEKLINTNTPLEDFADQFFENYRKQVRDDEKDNILEFEYYYRTGKLALCLGSLSRVNKRQSSKSFLVGAMAILLLLSTREEQSFDMIAKKVAYKGLETDYSFMPLNERDNVDFDWIKYLLENFETNKLGALLFLNRQNSFDKSLIKEQILTEISTSEPFIQNKILQYEL